MTEDTQVSTTDDSTEGLIDHQLGRFVDRRPRFTEAVDNILIPGFDEKLSQVLTDLDQERTADREMLDEFTKLPDAEAPSVDVKALSDADKTFDDHEVVSVARDCLLVLEKARVYEDPELGQAELSPALESTLRDAIGRDVSSHHHHLLPGVEIDDARIVQAVLVDGKEVVTVRLWLRGERLVRDDSTGAVVEGTRDEITWQEDWTLTRDPRVTDTSGEDQKLTLSGQWFVAHRGWVVTKIEPVAGSSDRQPPLLT